MEPLAEAPPEEEAATPTLLEKFRGRNTMLSVLGEHKSQEAKREAKRQRFIEWRQQLARRIAIYLRVGVCDYRGDALSRDASLRLLKAAQQIAGDRKVLGRALRAATEFMKDELLYEEELSEQGGLDESFVRSADSYERLLAKPFVPHRRTLRPVTLIRLIGKEVEHLDNPEAALDSLLYQASRLLNDFSDDGTPRASIEETPCPSPDRQSRERLDSRCFDSERIFRKREESLRKQRGSMLEEDELMQDSDIAIRQKSAQLDSIRIDDDELSDSPFKHVERRETIKERRKREGPRKKKLSKHIAKESAFLMELDALEAKELIDAACSNKTKKVLAIIKKSADGTPGAPSLDELFNTLHPQTGYAALHAAVEFNRTTCVRAMLKHGADINSPLSPLKRTPLHIAALQCNPPLVQLLKDEGADHMLIDEQFKRAYELVPEERSSSDPLISVMMESLKDGPDRVESVQLRQTSQRSFEVHWDILGDSIASTAASTRFFRVNWEQPVERKETEEYGNVVACYAPPTECCALFTEKREGVKLRHVKRCERVQNEFTEERMTTFEEEVKGVSLIKQLWPSTRYQAYVRASNAAGLGPPSPMAFTYTKPDVPDSPGAPFLCHVTASSVVAAWLPPRYDNGREVEAYELQRYVIGGTRAEKFRRALAIDNNPKRAAALVKEWTSHRRPDGETSDNPNDWTIGRREWLSCRYSLRDRAIFSFSGLTLGEKVCLRVRCQSDLGWSAWSRISSVFETGSSIYVSDVDSRSVTVSWDANAVKAQKWELQVQLQKTSGALPPWETVSDDIVNTTRKVDEGLLPGCAYRFRVRPLDNFGWRDWDYALITDTVRLLEDVPDAPSQPVGDLHKATEKTVYVEWAPNHDNGQPITSYELQHIPCLDDGEDDFDQAKSVELIAVHKAYRLEGCPPLSRFVFRVRAKNKHGWSAWSRISKACSTSTILPPGVPSLKESGATWLDVCWSPAPNGGVVRYEVEYREATAPVWRGGAVSEWRVLEGRDELRDDRVVLPDLKPQKAYECRVRALTLEGYSVFTDASEAMVTGRRY